LKHWQEEFSKYVHSKKVRKKNKIIKEFTKYEIQVRNQKIFIEPPI